MMNKDKILTALSTLKQELGSDSKIVITLDSDTMSNLVIAFRDLYSLVKVEKSVPGLMGEVFGIKFYERMGE